MLFVLVVVETGTSSEVKDADVISPCATPISLSCLPELRHSHFRDVSELW